MERCCICKSKITDEKNKYFLFTDKTGNKRLICNICKEHINHTGNIFGETNYRESISHFRNLCDIKKLKDPEVIDYLNENVMMFEEIKLTVGKTDMYDIITVAVKVVKWAISAAFVFVGLAMGIIAILRLWSTNDAFIGIIIGTAIPIGGGIIGFTFFSVFKLFEDWLFYRGTIKYLKHKN
ncbi:MAG: hypothetical protein FWD71_00540 [Oscillospiraceae bacterium]|nr:hypothetical protein [Oscillospiraceae bacterium]